MLNREYGIHHPHYAGLSLEVRCEMQGTEQALHALYTPGVTSLYKNASANFLKMACRIQQLKRILGATSSVDQLWTSWSVAADRRSANYQS